MRTLVPSILACVTLAAVATGCGHPERAPLDVNWTFGTLDCDQAGVATIHVDVAHELLNPNEFSCIDPRTGGVTTGASLGSFLLGQYTITVIGLDSTGAEIVEGTKTVSVARGQNVAQVDAGGAVTLQWTFDGLSCADAQVDFVNLSVDGTLITDAGGHADIPCNQAGQDAAQIAPLLAGVHSFDIVGFVGGNPTYSTNRVTVPVQDGQDSVVPINLPSTAPAAAELQFSFGSGQTCSGAGLDTVRIFVDPAANGTAAAVDDVPCTPSNAAVVSPLGAGTHSFAVDGIRAGVVLFETPNPVSAFFPAGLQSVLVVNVPAVAPAATGLSTASFKVLTAVHAKAFPARALAK
jgi:hypothetical protein